MNLRDHRGSLALVAALVLASPAAYADSSPFSIETSDLVPYAISALEQQYPDVSSDNLELTGPFFFNCNALEPVAGRTALGEARIQRTAMVSFEPPATGIEKVYLDHDGNCVIVTPPAGVMVRIEHDGRSRVHLYASDDDEPQIVECDDEMIASLARANKTVLGNGIPFSINANGILDLAFVAAAEYFPDIPPQSLVFRDGFSVNCQTIRKAGGRSRLDVETGPCQSSVRIDNDSVAVQYRYINALSCMIGFATDHIEVRIDQEGRTDVYYRENSGGGAMRGVECDEKFFDSALPIIENPHMDNGLRAVEERGRSS